MKNFEFPYHTGPGKLFLIAGPCVVEGWDVVHQTASELHSLCDELSIPLIFKASYRKANRSSIHSFTGIGDEKALQMLADVRETFGIPVITDIHTEREAAMAAEFVDIIQIPAFLCRQTDLLLAAAKTGKPVAIKKGQFMAPESMKYAVEKIREGGNKSVMLIERGTSFGYQDMIVDFRGIPVMQRFKLPVVVDCTHSLQKPNQPEGVTGGQPEYISLIAKASVASGADGLFIETHPQPSRAKSDGANMLPLTEMKHLLQTVVKIVHALA